MSRNTNERKIGILRSRRGHQNVRAGSE
jgi:hypothetical protein